MANLYGVSNPVIAPVYFTTIGGAAVNLPANTETVIATSPPLVAISSGFYYAMIVGNVNCYCSGGAINPFVIAARIGTGADFANQSWQATGFASLADVQCPAVFVSPSSQVAWQGAGSTVSVLATANGNAALANYPGTYFYVSLYRAPDQ